MQSIFVARQPIFDVNGRTVAFELLFRSADQDTANVSDGDAATSDLLRSAFVDIGLDKLVGDHLAFINLTRAFLAHPILDHLPADRVVLEILEDIPVDDVMLAEIRELKQRGFRIALDDYRFKAEDAPLVRLANVVKVDILEFDPAALARQVEVLGRFNVELLAEKVETEEAFIRCRELGFHYIQGYYLSRPNIVTGQRVRELRLSLIRIAAALDDPDRTVHELLDLIEGGPGLALQLLRLANSPLFRKSKTVETIREAIMMLGRTRVKDLALLIALRETAGPGPVLEQILVRARVAQLLSPFFATDDAGERFFILGLLSGLNRLLGVPIDQTVQELHLSRVMEDALLRDQGEVAPLLRLMAMQEEPHSHVDRSCPAPPATISQAYLEAMGWAREALAELQAA